MTGPFVFIVGAARSGTTLLQRMVDAHPEIAIVHESHWIPRVFEQRTGLTADGMVTDELLPALLEDRRFVKLGLERHELEPLLAGPGPVSYADFAAAVLELYGRARGKRLVGDKTPGYVRDVATLRELWPRARFVHVIRDGRDVCLSMRGWKRVDRSAGRFAAWRRDPVTTAALWWKWHVRLGLEAGAELEPARYAEVRYEPLVARPAEECAALCRFLGVAYDPSMLDFHEGREKARPGLDAKRAWRPITAGLRDWRTEMAREDLERFEAAAGDLLGELGYERACPAPGAAALRHAESIRSSLADEVRSSTDYPLPARH